MTQNPFREDDSASSSQEIPCLLWNMKLCYYVYKGISTDLIPGQLNPFHSLIPYFFWNPFNIILLSAI